MTAPAPVRRPSLLPPPQAIGDEVTTTAVTSETFAVPDETPKISDPLKVTFYILVFSIFAVNIWGIVDTTTYKFQPPMNNGADKSEPVTVINVVNIFSLITGSAGMILALLLLVATVLQSAKLFKLSYQALLMLLGAHTVVFLAVVIWYSVHHVKLEGPCTTDKCASVRITTVSWTAFNIAMFIIAAVLSRFAVSILDPVLHLLGNS